MRKRFTYLQKNYINMPQLINQVIKSKLIGMAPILAIWIVSISIIFSLVYWSNDLIPLLKSLPMIYYYVFYSLLIIGTVSVIVFGDRITKTVGTIGLFVLAFTIGITVFPQYVSALFMPYQPAADSATLAKIGFLSAIVLLSIGWTTRHQ